MTDVSYIHPFNLSTYSQCLLKLTRSPSTEEEVSKEVKVVSAASRTKVQAQVTIRQCFARTLNRVDSADMAIVAHSLMVGSK